MVKQAKFRPFFRWRLLFATLFLMLICGYAYTNELGLPLPLLPTNLITHKTPKTINQPSISTEDIVSQIQNIRTENNLDPLNENTTLEKTARLVSLEIEDAQDINTEINYERILNAVSLTKPPEVEGFVIFLAGVGKPDDILADNESRLFSKAIYTQIGVATRSATIAEEDGLIVVILSSPEFYQPPNNPQVNTQVITDDSNDIQGAVTGSVAQTSAGQLPKEFSYTGQDLWQAVQNYRRAHRLPEFQQSNELCTVASIRLNEQIELGRLDNHDGFSAQADEFFDKNPDWRNLNENLASGFDTAVQVVEWGWDQSLGHQALIKSLESPKACAAANYGFAVLITGK